MPELSADELADRLAHANRNSLAMTRRAEDAEAERNYWQARCALIDPVLAAAQKVAESIGFAQPENLIALRNAGMEYMQRMAALNRETAQARQERDKERRG
jgi:hypothetical protein